MSEKASYQQIVDYLATIPAASPSWAEVFSIAELSMENITVLVGTMLTDAESPLRQAEEGVLSQEIVKINQARGTVTTDMAQSGKYTYVLRGVLSMSERTRVVRLVKNFCQPNFESSRRFGSNGHAIMNAVRRILCAYIMATKVTAGCSVVEVGPDVTNWLMSASPEQWRGDNLKNYKAARPNISPRDTIRADWGRLAKVIARCKKEVMSDDMEEKARVIEEARAEVFSDSKIQDGKVKGEYIISFDSNYDIAFGDMPAAMAVCGARAWYGTLVRAKGLTRGSRITEGKLDLMGVSYRVDWKQDRIDFRHRECMAFGYSHKCSEYMKYEEHNGYVWTTSDAHYVYSKGPETNDEILFYQVVRVPKVNRMMEPRFVENPNAGMVEIKSVWGVGDEIDGLPTKFEAVTLYVDKLNWSKVLEKRISIGTCGDLASTKNLVRACNVRMWIHGTPVGTNNRIMPRLIEAVSVYVEAMVATNRLNTNYVFDKAMERFALNLQRDSWFMRLISNVIDLRVVSGMVTRPAVEAWSSVRSFIADKAMSSLSDLHVSSRVVPEHVALGCAQPEGKQTDVLQVSPSFCRCGEIGDLKLASESCADEQDRKVMSLYAAQLEKLNLCTGCRFDIDRDSAASATSDEDVGFSTAADSTDDDSIQEDGVSWLDKGNLDKVESKAMVELRDLELYLANASLVEARVDSAKIRRDGPVSDKSMERFHTGRTKHTVIEFLGQRAVRQFGNVLTEVGAVYDHVKDKMVSVRMKGQVMICPVDDGFYYTCDRFAIWNTEGIVAALEYALAYGVVSKQRLSYNVFLGVPGAGKTYSMMQLVAERYKERDDTSFVCLSATKASVAAAIGYGVKFGIPENVLKSRVCTIDSYLINRKTPSYSVYVDEFPMVHIGKVDACVSISGAKSIHIYGDAKQIPYDPFCSFKLNYAVLGDSVKSSNVVFEGKTHRLNEDTCAMWLDVYPVIYPCTCCEHVHGSSMEYVRVKNLTEVPNDPSFRYHAYKQDEKDDIRVALLMTADMKELRAKEVGGLSSVHEDQGSTHDVVITVRSNTVYDKNASVLNPSLYNRVNYVLTDTTRHKKRYGYYTMCEENDEVIKRIALSKDAERLNKVRLMEGMGLVCKEDMLF